MKFRRAFREESASRIPGTSPGSSVVDANLGLGRNTFQIEELENESFATRRRQQL
jgi:hypothetical protein